MKKTIEHFTDKFADKKFFLKHQKLPNLSTCENSHIIVEKKPKVIKKKQISCDSCQNFFFYMLFMPEN